MSGRQKMLHQVGYIAKFSKRNTLKLEEHLNPSSLKCQEALGSPLLVIAGAGSGKQEFSPIKLLT